MSSPLPHELSGNKSSNKIIVFLHGWPDTTAIWDDVIPQFETENYVLNISYPNYSQKERNPRGINFEELANRIKATIDHVNGTNRKIIVVSHDWGAAYGYFLDYLYPNYVSEMIALDIGARVSAYHIVFIFYQLTLVIAYLIGGFIGKWMTQGILKFFNYSPPWANRIDSSWNYSYWYMWKRIVLKLGNVEKAYLPGYVPSCNITFIYGAKKALQFHNQAWLDMLAKNPKSEVIRAENSEHWIQKDEPELVINLIRKKLEKL